MISYLLGSIRFGVDPLAEPTGSAVQRQTTTAQHGTTRGKPALQLIGEELDTRTLDFFFSEEFCDVGSERAKLEAAYAAKNAMPLVQGDGTFDGKRYIVDSLAIRTIKTDRGGNPVRIEASMTLLEDPIAGGLLSNILSIAKARAPAIASRSGANPELRK